jgi:hypothetical protein
MKRLLATVLLAASMLSCDSASDTLDRRQLLTQTPLGTARPAIEQWCGGTMAEWREVAVPASAPKGTRRVIEAAMNIDGKLEMRDIHVLYFFDDSDRLANISVERFVE